MTQAKAPVSFSKWLRAELTARDMGIRTLAREMNPDNPEQARRALNRYIHQGMRPTAPNRAALAAALGLEEHELPATDDEEEAQVPSLEAALKGLIREVLAEQARELVA